MRITGDLLVVRNDRLGDAILALPTVSLLREAFPDVRIYFWPSPLVAPLIRCVEGIDRVIAGNDHGRTNVVQELSDFQIHAAFCLRPTYRNALTLKKAHIPIRIGTSRRLYSILFTHRINLPRRSKSRHEVDLNLDLLSGVGIKGEPTFPKITPPESSVDKVKRLFVQSERVPNQPYVVIHPGSGGSAQNWSPIYFRKLAKMLADRHSYNVIVTGSPNEVELCRAVAGDDYLNLCGRTDLLELAALLQDAHLLVTNSTGPLHLGVALGTLSVGLYAPLVGCLPERWGPYGHPEWALIPDLPICRKCRPGEIPACRCLEQLTPDMVYEHLMKLLVDS